MNETSENSSIEVVRNIRSNLSRELGRFYLEMVTAIGTSRNKEEGEQIIDDLNTILDDFPDKLQPITNKIAAAVLSGVRQNQRIIEALEKKTGNTIAEFALREYLALTLKITVNQAAEIIQAENIRPQSYQPLPGLVVIGMETSDKRTLHQKYGFAYSHDGLHMGSITPEGALNFIYAEDITKTSTIVHETHHFIWRFLLEHFPLAKDKDAEQVSSLEQKYFNMLKNELIAYLFTAHAKQLPLEKVLTARGMLPSDRKQVPNLESTPEYQNAEIVCECFLLAWDVWLMVDDQAQLSDFVIPFARSTDYADLIKNMGLLVFSKTPSTQVLDAFVHVAYKHPQRAREVLLRHLSPNLTAEAVMPWIEKHLQAGDDAEPRNRLAFLRAIQESFPEEFWLTIKPLALQVIRQQPVVSRVETSKPLFQ